jgi:L-amino acid N-acyltransferase YncA
MLIRDADAERDAAACADIYAPYVSDTVISLEERAPSETELADRIRDTTSTHPWLVAEDANELIGYAYAGSHRTRACYRWATDVAVYVSPDRQRRGVGRALYQTLFPLLAAQGFRIACAGITLPNDASVGLHEALGFRPVGVYRNIGFKHGAWRDVGWWQLELAGPDGHPPDPGPPTRLAEKSDEPGKSDEPEKSDEPGHPGHPGHPGQPS